MDRRTFIRRLAKFSMLGSGIAAAGAGISGLVPPGILRYRRYTIGRPEHFRVGEFTYIPERKLYLFRSHETFHGLSAVCPHLGCTVRETGNGFKCPCHGSEFDPDGILLKGPARRDMNIIPVELNQQGLLEAELPPASSL